MSPRAPGLQLDLFADELPVVGRRMPPGAQASECGYCFHTYGTHAEGCARPQWPAKRGLQIREQDDGTAWLEAYWQGAPRVNRGRFKAMSACRVRPAAGLRQVRVLSNTRTLAHG